LEARASSVILPTCSQSDVNSAISSASDGDAIVCPGGSWSWSDVNISNKNITLQGAGIGNTIISITSAGGVEAPANNTKAFRVTGFTFKSTGNFGTDSGYAMMRIQGGKGWRVDHNEFQIYSNVTNYAGGNGLFTNNDIAGLIDHNRFVKNPAGSGCMHASVYPDGAGATAWGWPSRIGNSDHTVFIEDNYFFNPDYCPSHNPHAVYGQRGGIYVARHNEIHNMDIDSHGFCADVGTREYEISNNEWVIDNGNNVYTILNMRGGTGVIYNNTVTKTGSGSATYGLYLDEYRGSKFTQCGGITQNGINAGTACAGNEGYPCVDQIGRGQNQTSDPLYFWGNKNFPSNRIIEPTFIQANRDYYSTGPKPGYTGYQYPHPLTGAPCKENCVGQQPPPVATLNPPVILRID
jgi:hypothetical protein